MASFPGCTGIASIIPSKLSQELGEISITKSEGQKQSLYNVREKKIQVHLVLLSLRFAGKVEIFLNEPILTKNNWVTKLEWTTGIIIMT